MLGVMCVDMDMMTSIHFNKEKYRWMYTSQQKIIFNFG